MNIWRHRYHIMGMKYKIITRIIHIMEEMYPGKNHR